MKSEENKWIIEEIKRRTGRKAYSLKINKEKQAGIFDSKFGGMPYWDLNKAYPVDSAGNKLMLLAQINFDKADVDEVLPQCGMLQFFIGRDDVFGADFDNPDIQNTFKVIYHETVDYSVTEKQILNINPPVSTSPENEEFSPVFRESAVNISEKEVYMGDGDYRFEELFSLILKDKFNKNMDEQSSYSYLGEEEYEEMIEEIGNQGHWLLGYPYFTQYDPREYTEKYRYYNTLLFQMDSDYIDKTDYVLWGDCGVANFFINDEDLKKKDFSRVLYNWDCC